ncbi:hypothetical protein [Candidatus Palauibacter sp.]|uniref:hypothetical protein n=1 Tax=Candidatus Palauibacter sp. TaxID=3101350 RepID=UPI003C6EEC90
MVEGPPHFVLEGNRRLAAIRLFTDHSLAARIRERTGTAIKVPDMPPQYRATLDTASAFCVPDRDAARSFIGFKHINGAHRWDAFAKARFATKWHREGNVPLEEIARSIGDRHDTIKRMVHAIYILEQAESAGVFSVDDRNTTRFSFSHLYTALARATYRRFFGLVDAWTRYEPKTEPIPPDKVDELGEVLRWIYGSKEDDVQPVVQSQNPHLKMLGDVVVNDESLLILRETGSLEQAAASLEPVGAKFKSALVRARDELRQALAKLRGFDVRDTVLLDVAKDNLEAAETIHERMIAKVRAARRHDE